MSEDVNRRAVASFLDALAAGDGHRLGELIHPDVVPPPMFARSDMSGPDAARVGLLRLHDFFTNVRFDVHELLADGDGVAARFTLSGTHTGEFFGVAPTGRDFTMDEMLFYHLKEGRLIEWWALFDLMGALRQLGAVPEEGFAVAP